jgi:hypothetical protein
VSFAAITLCVASERVFIVIVVYFVIDSVRELLDTPTYVVSRKTQLRCQCEYENFGFSDLLKICSFTQGNLFKCRASC